MKIRLPQKKIVIEDRLRNTPEAKKHMSGILESASNHDEGYLDIPFIEKGVGANLIYDHIRKGQITPEYIRLINTDDLIYIAGHTEPNSTLDPDEMARVKANAIRAKQEIDRRSRKKQLIVTAIVAFTAAILGAAATIVASAITLPK